MKAFYALLTITTSLMLCSIGAHAEDVGVNIDGKNIQITEVKATGERVFHSNEFPKGIFVIANSSPASGDRFPNAETIISARLKLQGFKVVEKVEDASVAIKFATSGTITTASVDSKAAYSMLPNAGQVTVNAGGAIASALTSGPAGVVGFLIGGLYQSDSKGLMFVEVLQNPVVTRGWRGNENIGSGISNGTFAEGLHVYYRLEKDKEAQDDTIMKMLIDQWIKRYLVLDTEPVAATTGAPIPASAVTASMTLEEAKK
ncbi:MAG: hypothetical protein PHQ60_02135 [Sideroxydans sp.]|nr:hypothetical protein [Sideroxydans sp.]MDD5056642.1 hypothetical protein [Sideroxydans sp.]